MNRRTFLRTAGGAAGSAAAMSAGTGSATAAGSGGGGGGGGGTKPDYKGYLNDANNFNKTVDKTGKKEVTVDVGAGDGLAFGPAAVHVDNGATVKWEWTGEGGAHNVVAEGGSFKSGSPKSSGTFKHTFKKDGIYKYYCSPHKGSGMKGAIVVGKKYPTKKANASTPLKPSHMGSNIREHYVGISVILAISVSLVFTFFLLKYGESAHTSGGNN